MLAGLALAGGLIDRRAGQKSDEKHSKDTQGLREQLIEQRRFQAGSAMHLSQSLQRVEKMVEEGRPSAQIREEIMRSRTPAQVIISTVTALLGGGQLAARFASGCAQRILSGHINS